jgi:hypothetical protein
LILVADVARSTMGWAPECIADAWRWQGKRFA